VNVAAGAFVGVPIVPLLKTAAVEELFADTPRPEAEGANCSVLVSGSCEVTEGAGVVADTDADETSDDAAYSERVSGGPRAAIAAAAGGVE
jgi:hypothetical protein